MLKLSEKIHVGWGSLAVSIVVLTIKLAAWKVSKSSALFSDALETIINVAAAIGTLWALKLSMRPADEEHLYGHGKAEYLSAVAEGVLIVLTALGIVHVAWRSWHNPTILAAPWAGIGLSALGGVVNLLWAITLNRRGRMLRSPALIASASHVISDVWTTLALVGGLALIPLTHVVRIDALLSIFVALNVLRVGLSVMRRSISGLMDEAPDPHTLESIRTIIAREAKGALEAHDLRMRLAGSISFIEFHLVVPGTLSVSHAHEMCDRIENGLRQHVGSCVIHIHVEPEEKIKHSGIRMHL